MIMSTPTRHGSAIPSAWVQRFAPLICASGSVLDLAAGAGRNARWLAAAGFRVVAVDRDAGVLDIEAAEERQVIDLEEGDWPFLERRFDGIVVTNYLSRPLFPRLCESLALGGVLIYETFADGNQAFGRPTRAEFLLQPGELLRQCGDLRVVAFEDGYTESPKPACVQRICAVRSDTSSGIGRFRL